MRASCNFISCILIQSFYHQSFTVPYERVKPYHKLLIIQCQCFMQRGKGISPPPQNSMVPPPLQEI